MLELQCLHLINRAMTNHTNTNNARMRCMSQPTNVIVLYLYLYLWFCLHREQRCWKVQNTIGIPSAPASTTTVSAQRLRISCNGQIHVVQPICCFPPVRFHIWVFRIRLDNYISSTICNHLLCLHESTTTRITTDVLIVIACAWCSTPQALRIEVGTYPGQTNQTLI